MSDAILEDHVITSLSQGKVLADLDQELQEYVAKDYNLIEKLETQFPGQTQALSRLKSDFIKLKCGFCGTEVTAYALSSIDDRCPQCKRGSLKIELPYFRGTIFNAPLYAELLMKNTEFLAFKDTGQLLYYDSGVWTYKGEQYIQKRLVADLKYLYKTNYVKEVVSYIQGKNYAERDIIHTFITESNGDLLFNFPNGVYSFKQGRLLEPNPDFYFSSTLPFRYDADALPKDSLDFIWQISNNNFETWINLMECAAWTLMPDNRFQKLVLLWGEGANGKSTYLNLLLTFIGREASTSLTVQQLIDNRFMKADLFGKQINVAGDLPSEPISDTGLLKALRGQDMITVEEKGKTPFRFVSQTRNIWSANKFPKTGDDTRAFYRSWQIIYLTKIFRNDGNLFAKITTKTELAGLFNLLVRYFLPALMQRSDFTYAKTPEENQQLYDRKADSSKLFIDTCIIGDPQLEIWKDQLRTDYEHYCANEKLVPETDKAFRQALNSSGISFSEHMKDGRRLYRGISLRQVKAQTAMQQDERSSYIVQTDGDFLRMLKEYENLNRINNINNIFPILQSRGNKVLIEGYREKPVNPVNVVNDFPSEKEAASAANLPQGQPTNAPAEQPQPRPSPDTNSINPTAAILNLFKKDTRNRGLLLNDGLTTNERWGALYNLLHIGPEQIDAAMQQLERLGEIYELRPGNWKRAIHDEPE